MRCGLTGGVVLALAVLAGCAQAPQGAQAGQEAQEAQVPTMTPAEALARAAKVNGRGVQGRFAFEVKAVGTNGDDYFIHSERDYRDARSLNVRLSPRVREQLEARLGGKLGEVLVGRRIVVRGAAKRVRINLVHAVGPSGALGHLTGMFYYQTHVTVKEAGQIELI
jgi:hypothetical protein